MNRKCVLVTGSSIGLGSYIIRKFASYNYDVVITYNTHKKEALELQKEVTQKYNINALIVKCDISKENDIENLKNEILNTFGKLDVLVNNASIAIDTTFDDKTKKNFMTILEINYLTSKNKKNTEGKLEVKKFCSRCNKTTAHKEKKA